LVFFWVFFAPFATPSQNQKKKKKKKRFHDDHLTQKTN
jgi:hypothetical protein